MIYVLEYSRFFILGIVCVFLMRFEEVVDRVMSDITRQGGFPEPVPSVMNVVGGSDRVRAAVVLRLAEKYKKSQVWGNLGNGKGYRIILGDFVRKYDSSLC